MKGIFVNETGCVHYALMLAHGHKTIETRNRDMLSACVGERVAIVRTRRNVHGGYKPQIVGYVTITRKAFCKAEDFDKWFWNPHGDSHLVAPQSKYAPQNGKGKWFYFCSDAEACVPYPLPDNAVRHGRSWCEWEA